MSRFLAGAVLAALSACTQGPPSGQVVVRASGVEITRRDVLIELLESGAPEDVDTRTIQSELLDRIVIRKLMAEEARRQSIDRSPEFLGKERRSRELILGDQLVQRLVGRLPPPSQRAVARFLASNRARFDRRRILRVDRIETAADAGALLATARSTGAVAARLTEAGLGFERSARTVDSITLSDASLRALEAARQRPSITAAGDRMVIEQVVSAIAHPLDPAQRDRIAVATLRSRMAQAAVDGLKRRLREQARIEYQVKPARP